MYADLIQENATVTGTGPITLAGNVTGWRKYSDAFGSGKKVRYFIQNETRLQWESGEGTFTVAGPDVLSRDKVVRSSNGNNLVNFDDSAKTVICSADADTIRFGASPAPVATGTKNARIVAYDPPLTALIDGHVYAWINGAAANDDEATVDLGPGETDVVQPDGFPLEGGEMPADGLILAKYIAADDELRLLTLPPQNIDLDATAIKQGRHTIWVPAGAMVARTTNGAASGTVETTTNKVMLKTLDFDASTIEYAQFAIRMPKGWNEGTVSAVFVWSHAATTTNFKVSWGLQAVAISDDDALDAAFGTAQYANDTGGTTNDAYASPETSAITIAGTPAAEDLVIFQVLRKADDGTNDTLAIDARLHGVTLYITINAPTDA